MLDRFRVFCYPNQARSREPPAEVLSERSRTLKTIQREKRARKELSSGGTRKRGRDSEDSKEFCIERCEGLNTRV